MKKRAINRENSWIGDIWLFAQASGFFTHPPSGPFPRVFSALCFGDLKNEGWRGRLQVECFFLVSFYQKQSSDARSAGREANLKKTSVILPPHGPLIQGF